MTRSMTTLAALATVVAAGLLAALRLGVVGNAGTSAATPDAMLPVLVATGLLCVVGLSRAKRPTVTSLATIGALVIITVDLAAWGRAARLDMDATSWLWLVVAVSLTAIMGVLAASAYAMDPRRPTVRWAQAISALALVAVAAADVWAFANADAPIDPDSPLGALVIVTRTFLGATAILTIAGLVADIRPAVRRARRRVATTRPDPSGAGERIAWLNAVALATIDELAPGRWRARQAAVAERSRIAREMHAEVVPSLRRSLASAEAGDSAEALASSLRETLEQVEGVIDAEHSIHLEISGLVPALEATAESIEARSDVTVAIDVVEGGVGDAPMDVAIAAVRVARLALDNVARHAPGSGVTVTVAESATRVSMTIVDDGPGVTPSARAAALEHGRRGLVDMSTEAHACGATLSVEPAEPGRGTSVRFDWPGEDIPRP